MLEPYNAEKDGSCRTLKARDYKNSNANYKRSDGMGATGVITYNGKKCRVRKLTPLECWRLMGFKDSDFIKAATLNPSDEDARRTVLSHELTGVSITELLGEREKKTSTSNSQLYKQAGNSIVVDVLTHLFSSVKTAVPEAFE